jgi:cell division protease FtsH
MAAQAPKGSDPKRDPGASWIGWLIATIFLIAWNLAMWPRAAPTEVAIPYSGMLAQVRAGNVAAVRIVGDKITGTFKHPILPPPPTPSAGAPAPPTPAPASTSPPQRYGNFRTTFPQAVGDQRLMPLLDRSGVVVDAATPTQPVFLQLLLSWGPLLLLFGVVAVMSLRASRNLSGGAFGFGKVRAKEYTSDQPRVTFDDVAGASEAKAELQEEVDFLRHPEKYHRLGARIPRGVLLVGSPGTGKTLVARAVAGEAGVPFLSLNASEFVEMFVGVGASRVRDLFAKAKEMAPAIVFIDELDAVGRRRGAGIGQVNDEREQTLNQLLGELDGFDPRANVIVLAATNRPDVLDPALLRPGRFDRQITVPLPDREGREGILRIHVRPLTLDPEVNIPRLAAVTIGMSGADLANLCNEAALAAAQHERAAVTMVDFEEALDRIRLGAAHPQLMDADERRIVAYHESGHALTAWFTPGADPVLKVTIVPHGQALGMTEQLPAVERHNLSRSYLFARLSVMLGGRTAEEIALGEITTGAENDLVEATKLARQMVTRWGMSDVGLAAFAADEEHPFLGYEMAQGRDFSEETAAQIDRAVQLMLRQAHDDVHLLLSSVKDQLDTVVQALLAHESVDSVELEKILGAAGRPLSSSGATNNGAQGVTTSPATFGAPTAE